MFCKYKVPMIIFSGVSYASALLYGREYGDSQSLAVIQYFLGAVFLALIIANDIFCDDVRDELYGVTDFDFCSGVIVDIEYTANIRNNIPLFDVRVRYLGMEKLFNLVDAKIQTHYRVGDSIIIKYSRSDPIKSAIEFE